MQFNYTIGIDISSPELDTLTATFSKIPKAF